MKLNFKHKWVEDGPGRIRCGENEKDWKCA